MYGEHVQDGNAFREMSMGSFISHRRRTRLSTGYTSLVLQRRQTKSASGSAGAPTPAGGNEQSSSSLPTGFSRQPINTLPTTSSAARKYEVNLAAPEARLIIERMDRKGPFK